MYKLAVLFAAAAAAAAAVAACVTAPPSEEAAPLATAAAVQPQTPFEPDATHDVADFQDARRSCEGLTRPGSRIVVAHRCRPIDEESLAEQINQVSREQDQLDRLAREREAQRRGF